MKTMIYYEKFSEAAVFSDPRLNVFFNQVYTTLINILDESTVTSNLIVDGDVALLLQLNPVARVDKIKLSTFSNSVWSAIRSSASSFAISDIVETDNKVTVRFLANYIEFCLIKKPLKLELYNGITINSVSDILTQL